MCRCATASRRRLSRTAPRLFLVDFAYPAEQLVQLRQSVAHITILDHHKSARAALADIREQPPRFAPDQAPPGLFALFDMEESGATLTWQYFHPETDCPELLRYIKDRDLWQHVLPDSRAINAAIRSYPHDFRVWAEKLDAAEALTQLRADGEAILRKQAHDLEELLVAVMWMDLGGERVPVVNSTGNTSELGHRLCEIFPEAAVQRQLSGYGRGIDGSGVSVRWATSMSVRLPSATAGAAIEMPPAFRLRARRCWLKPIDC